MTPLPCEGAKEVIATILFILAAAAPAMKAID
jgi:hypothetical protein